MENDDPGFKEFFECFSGFSDDEIDYRYSDSDSEDSETDSD